MAASLMFAYAGFLYVTASSNRGNLESAKKIFWNVLLGLIFILTAFLIVDLVLRVFTGSSFNVLTEIRCERWTFSGVTPNRVPVEPATGAGGVGNPTQPGGGTPASGERLSDADARAYAASLGLEVSPGVSTMDGTSRTTIDNAKALQDACGCRVVITSTTGGTHQTSGSCTHASGCKFDARSKDEGTALRSWIEANLTPTGARSNGDRLYRDGCGNVYAIEQNVRDPHIDIESKHACPSNLIKTRG